MDALQTIVDFFSSMGTSLVAALFVLIALILVWLIVRASRRGSDSTPAADKRAQPNRYHQEPELRQDKVPAPRPAGSGQPSVAAPASRSEKPVGEKSREPVASLHDKGEAVMPEPEDSVLHRHFDAELAAKKEALAHPYPTDSVLRRHYDTLHALQLDESPAAVEVAPKPSSSAAGEQKIDARSASIIEQAIKRGARVTELPAVELQSGTKGADIRLPQDSVLKRHYLSQLQAEISAAMSPRPTDSVLRRHYDGMVQSELEKRLHRS
ncbi:MAG: hypothetical protein M0R33_12620 [Methylomonas sp.]|uniref:hypothetical protein n=1 Tax=Methylomonas sp. TaxID=418 RepID=UPI0025F449FD|nr:hypothetical protein [Methylomonas sp.]MCK9607277.1 hypothetical protein [Methylomonas sp.]